MSHIMVLHRNTECIIFTLVHLLTIFDAVLGYDSKCPLAFQWNVRSKLLCIVELHYTCLYDDVKGNTIESCNGPLPFIAKGYTWVIRGNPDRDKCSQGTYQPYKHRNLKSSNCVYKKSICSEEGQVIHDTGNNTDDHTCRCDYRRGYDFVVKHRNQCYCYPSKEDCSCYIRQCDNTDTSLSQDYQCKETFNTTTVCSMIKEDFENEFKPDLFTRFRQKDADLYWLPVVITILIVFPTVGIPVVLFAVHVCQYLHRPVFVANLKDIYCIQGDQEVILQCKVAWKNKKATWSTDSKTPLSKSQIISFGTMHQIIIKNVQQSHSGTYTVTVCCESSTAYLTVKEYFLEPLTNQSCILDDTCQLSCRTAGDFLPPAWYKDNKTIDEYICFKVITSKSREKDNIYQLTIPSIKAHMEGEYMIKLGNRFCSASVKVKDIFNTKLQNLFVMTGDDIHLKCELAREYEVVTWKKEDTKYNFLKSAHYMISKEGKIHSLKIVPARVTDTGTYVVEVNSAISTSLVTVIDIFSSRLKSLTCSFGEDVKFECTSIGKEGTAHTPYWFKEENESDTFSHWQTISYRHKHALGIKAVSFEDEGLYTIKVKNDTSQANLKVEDKLSINSEDIYYVLSVHAICKIAIPAVRKIFDREFKPDDLCRIVSENTDKLRPLRKRNAITKDQWRLLNGDCTTSKDLGLRLMVFLLRNITFYKIENKLPPETDKHELDDLCRIDYYRNIFAHYQKRMSDTEFQLCLKDITEAAQRLTDAQQCCSPIVKSTQPRNDNLCTSDDLTLALKASIDRNEPEEIKEIIRNIEGEEMNYLRIVFLLHRIGCPAVRYKFNSICCPAELKQILKNRQTKLDSYKRDNKITTTQWNSLFPIGDKPSSKNFDLKLMLTLMIELGLSPTEQEETEALILLNSKLHTLARSNNGKLSDKEFDVDWVKICEAIIVLGGNSCGKRFNNLCCVLRPEKKKYLQTLLN